MSELDDLSLRVLRLLSVRPPGSGFEMITIANEPDESLSAIVERLRFDHLIDAAFIEHSSGTTPAYWVPSTLTDKGRRVLASLDSVVCPTCFQPMRLLEGQAQDDGAHPGGKQFECATHGVWHLGPNAGFLSRAADWVSVPELVVV